MDRGVRVGRSGVRPRRTLRWPVWWVGGGVAGLLVAGVVTWLVWPEPAGRTPRALEFQDFDVCVLTDGRGIVGGPAASVWAGLQEVVTGARARLSYLQVAGPQTQEQAQLFVPALVQQGCDVIVGVGGNQVAAVSASESTYPNIRVLVVSSDADVDGVVGQVSALLPSE